MYGPDLDHLTDNLPKAESVFLLVRDDGGQYDRNEHEIAASTNEAYIQRLKAQLLEAERQAQVPEALNAWRRALTARGVPIAVAEGLDPPEQAVLEKEFDFFRSSWSVREIDVIDAARAVKREAMLARANALEV
jgi:hypothetical protein